MEDKREFKNVILILVNFNDLVNREICVRGRITSIRRMKNFVFMDLYQADHKIQVSMETAKSHGQVAAGDFVEICGICAHTKSGEPTINILDIDVLGKWTSTIGYKDIRKIRSGSARAFLPESYGRVFFAQAVRNHIRRFLISQDFIEVHTPLLSSRYNGG